MCKCKWSKKMGSTQMIKQQRLLRCLGQYKEKIKAFLCWEDKRGNFLMGTYN